MHCAKRWAQKSTLSMSYQLSLAPDTACSLPPYLYWRSVHPQYCLERYHTALSSLAVREASAEEYGGLLRRSKHFCAGMPACDYAVLCLGMLVFFLQFLCLSQISSGWSLSYYSSLPLTSRPSNSRSDCYHSQKASYGTWCSARNSGSSAYLVSMYHTSLGQD